MDRRVFVAGLLGVAAATGFAAALPRQARALPLVPPGLKPEEDVLPRLTESDAPLTELDEDWELDDGEEEGFQPARHRRRHRRRRRRVRRWRRVCRRWKHKGHWHRRCRRRPHWVYIWFWI